MTYKYVLKYCDICAQKTNHLEGKCQKCDYRMSEYNKLTKQLARLTLNPEKVKE